jgi:hypothetical protein
MSHNTTSWKSHKSTWRWTAGKDGRSPEGGKARRVGGRPALARQKTVGQHDQRAVPMQAIPAPALIVVQATRALRVFVELLDPRFKGSWPGEGIFYSGNCDTRSHDELSGVDQTCCSINSTLGVRCGEVTNRAEATLTMNPRSQDWRLNREGTAYLPASGGDGARVDGMVNVSDTTWHVKLIEDQLGL